MVSIGIDIGSTATKAVVFDGTVRGTSMVPDTGRFTLVELLIRDFTFDGIIDLTWQACHT